MPSLNMPVQRLKVAILLLDLLRCATYREVAGSIPDGVTGIFHCHNTSGRTMALRSTQPLTGMRTRDISLGVKAASA